LVITVASIGGCSQNPTSPTPPAQPHASTTPPIAAPQSAPPSIACPGSISTTAPLTGPALVQYPAPVTAAGEGPVDIACTPAADDPFPVGNTTVECKATDALQRTATCSFAVAVAPAPRLSRSHILAFGDSITFGEQVIPNTDNVLLAADPATAYPTVLAQLLRARYGDRPTVVNAGLSGEKAAFGDRRLPFEIGKSSADVVVLLEGANDLLYADPPSSAAIQAAELGVSVLAAEGRHRGLRVFIALLTPTKPGRRHIPLATIQFANDRLRVVARGEGASVIDTFSALLPDLNANIGSDGLHPTALGYRRIAEAVFAALRADLDIH